MFSRSIQMHFGEGFTDAIGDHMKSAEAAIGYLCRWAIHSPRYSKVLIYGDKCGNIHATYRNETGDITYDMSAIRHEDGTYSTHS